MAKIYEWVRPPKGPRRLYQGKLLKLPAANLSSYRARIVARAIPEIQALIKEARKG